MICDRGKRQPPGDSPTAAFVRDWYNNLIPSVSLTVFNGYVKIQETEVAGMCGLDESGGKGVHMENKYLKKTILDNQLKTPEPICISSGERVVFEWEEIARLVQKGYAALEHKPIQYPVMTKNWMEAWEILKKLVSGAEMKLGISDLDEATDYEYGLEGWLQDMEMELHNAGEHEKRLQFCREVLELFSWQHEDSGGYKMAFVESLYALDRKEEGEDYLNDWLEQEPHNTAAINTKSVCLAAEGQEEAAYGCLEQEIGDQSCTLDNEILFARICWLAEKLGKTDKLDFYKEKYEEFQKSLEEMEINPCWGGLPYMPSQPIVKSDKIYPNDPCPCGSGKKYKKCCGKNR